MPTTETKRPTKMVSGADLKVGDVVVDTFWGSDIVTGFRAYAGPFNDGPQSLLGGSARIADFAVCNTGMTVCADDVFTVEAL